MSDYDRPETLAVLALVLAALLSTYWQNEVVMLEWFDFIVDNRKVER